MLLYCDSFDVYTNLTQKYDTVSGGGNSPVISTSAARNGPNGLFFAPTLVGASQPFVEKNFTARQTYIVGFGFQARTGCVDTFPIIGFWDGGTNQIELRMSSTGNFQFWTNGTAIGSQTPYALAFNSWHYLEVMVTISNSSGVAQLHVDCVPVIALAGIDSQASGNASASGVVWGSPYTNGAFGGISNFAAINAYYDDLYVLDPTGSYNTTYLGDVKISAQIPSGNGGTNNFTQNVVSRAAGTSYTIGNSVVDPNGNLQRATTNGTTLAAASSNNTTGKSTSAFAMKGVLGIVPTQLLTVDAVSANIYGNSGDVYQALIYSITGTSTIGSIVGASATHTFGSTVTSVITFTMSGVTLMPGNTYAVVIQITSGTSTTPCEIDYPTGIGWTGPGITTISGSATGIRSANVSPTTGTTLSTVAGEPSINLAVHPVWATTPLTTITQDNSVAWQLIQVAPLSNYNLVNEIPPDDNNSHVSDATVNDEDLYTFPAMTGATVYAAVVNLRAEKDDSGTRSIRALAESGGTTVDSGTDIPLSQNVYADYQGVFETDPNTGLPWTIAGINGAQFGIKTTA